MEISIVFFQGRDKWPNLDFSGQNPNWNNVIIIPRLWTPLTQNTGDTASLIKWFAVCYLLFAFSVSVPVCFEVWLCCLIWFETPRLNGSSIKLTRQIAGTWGVSHHTPLDKLYINVMVQELEIGMPLLRHVYIYIHTVIYAVTAVNAYKRGRRARDTKS